MKDVKTVQKGSLTFNMTGWYHQSMKIGFFLQRNFATVGHAIAGYLKEKHGIDEFCAYVSPKSSLKFLEEHTDLSYTKLILDEEIHERFKREPLDLKYIEWLEKEYGTPNLWPYLVSDRVLMHGQLIREYPYDEPQFTHEEMLRQIQVTAKAIIKFLETEKPEAIVFSIVCSMGSMLLYRIAAKKGIKTLVIWPVLIKNRYILSSKHDTFSPKDENYWSAKTPIDSKDKWYIEAEKYLEDFIAKPAPYYQAFDPDKQMVNMAEQFKFLSPARVADSLRALLREFLNYYRSDSRRHYTTPSPWHYLIDRIKRKAANLRVPTCLYDAPGEEDFAFFPLQYQPELWEFVQAPEFYDQLYVIRLAAASLPVGWKLYVKEHPQMTQFRRRSFYDSLKRIPNVKLIRPGVKSFGLIERSKLIITINSTVGWEATLMGKPVITFGRQFFNDLSFVKKCRALEDLPQIVKQQLENFRYDRNELISFIAAILKKSADVNLVQIWTEEKDYNKKRTGIADLGDKIFESL